MKHKPIYLLLLLLVTATLAGQSRFNRKYSWGESQPELLVLDSSYVSMYIYDQNKNGLVIREYDLLGDVVDSAYYLFDDTPFTTGHCLYKLEGKQRYIGAFSIGGQVRFIKFSRQWDTLSSGIHKVDTNYTSVRSLYPDSDSTFMACGPFDGANNLSGLYLCRVDTSLNVLWEKRYQDTTNVTFGGYFGGFITPVSDKGYLLGLGGSYASLRPNKAFIIRTDSQGNELWKKEFSPPERIAAIRLKQRKDGNYFYITSQSLDTNFRGYQSPEILRYGIIDTSGNILEDKYIGPILDNLHSSAFTQTLDGHFVIGGYTYVDPGKDVSYLFKFNEDGDSIWHRQYWHGYPEGLSILYAAKATPDSGLILAGDFLDAEGRYYTFGGVSNWTWLLKLDQYGCDTAGCEQVGIEEQAPAGLTL